MLIKNGIRIYLLLLSACYLLTVTKVGGQTFPDFRRACVTKNNRDIILNWSPLSNPCGKFIKLYVYARNNSTNPYVLLDSIDNITVNNYTHLNGALVANTWQYFLRFNYVCGDTSSYSDTLLLDINQPGENPIDSVSVDPVSGKVIIGWSASAAPDILGYVTWRTAGSNNIPFDTAYNTFYTDTSTLGSSGPAGYKLTAFDSCFNQSIISSDHRTVYATRVLDTCNNKVTLNWTAYKGWVVDGYYLYRRQLPGDYELIATLPATTTSFVYPGNYQDSLDFYIRAFNTAKGFTSRSNTSSLRIPAFKMPAYNYISTASVSGTELEIKGKIDVIGNTGTFYLLRSANDIYYDTIVKKAFDHLPDWNYQDKSVDITKKYWYKVLLKDLCKRWQGASNISNNVVLKKNDLFKDTVALYWNHYGTWDGSVGNYTIYRSENTGTGFTWNMLTDINYPDSQYYDIDVYDDILSGSICYYLVANERNVNTYNIKETSVSNIICFSEPLKIYFPSAIVASGINNQFIPKGTSINLKESSIEIYSRMGQRVYSSDLSVYWDGKDTGGTMLPSGVYMYIATVIGFDNSKEFHKGTITLIH